MSETLPTTDVRTLLGIISEDEFGRAVGVVGPTVAIWRNRGEGPPFYRFKRNIFYRTADVIQWIIENTIDPTTQQHVIPRAVPLPSFKPTPAVHPDPMKVMDQLDRMVDKLTSNPLQVARAPDDEHSSLNSSHTSPADAGSVRSNRQPAVEDDADEEPAASAG